MASAVRVVLPTAEQNRSNERSMALVTAFARVDVPYAPQQTTHGGFARKSEIVARPMLRDLLRVGGPGLKTLSFTMIVAYVDGQRSVEPVLAKLIALAESADPVSVRYGPLERSNLWRITDLTINGAARRPGTPDRQNPNLPAALLRALAALDTGSPNDMTRATVALQFTQVSDPLYRITPVAKAATRKPPTPGKPAPKPSTAPAKAPAPPPLATYAVRSGDTLSDIAARLLGDNDRFREIATLNGISNPDRISAGQILRVPKR